MILIIAVGIMAGCLSLTVLFLFIKKHDSSNIIFNTCMTVSKIFCSPQSQVQPYYFI